MSKNWLDYEQQVELLSQRGMCIDDKQSAVEFLSQVNYYRFSGYFRHWQHDPAWGDNQFFEGTSFETIRALYDAEQELVTVCDELLHLLEVLLHTRFAHAYGRCVGVTGTFAHGEGFTQSPRPGAERVEEHALSNLDRSKEAFVAHYRDDIKQGRTYKPEAYDRMPIWVAVEAFSFGSLSRLIEASGASGVLDDIAVSMNTSRKLLPGHRWLSGSAWWGRIGRRGSVPAYNCRRFVCGVQLVSFIAVPAREHGRAVGYREEVR